MTMSDGRQEYQHTTRDKELDDGDCTGFSTVAAWVLHIAYWVLVRT